MRICCPSLFYVIVNLLDLHNKQFEGEKGLLNAGEGRW